MKLHVVAVGTRMPPWVADGFADYAGRMPRIARLSLIEVKAEAIVERARKIHPPARFEFTALPSYPALDTPVDSAIDPTVTTVGQPAHAAITSEIPTPSPIPAAAPSSDSAKAVSRNWKRMSPRRAPTAPRRPGRRCRLQAAPAGRRRR